MSIKDYANEMNFTIQEVLNQCKELGIKANDGNFMLSDDDIIMLDNSMNLISTDSEANFDDIDALDDAVDEILGDQKDYTVKKQKLKKKNNQNNKDNNDYLKKKKAMYKNKTKLANNVADENIVVYEEGMTVGKLAESLGINNAEIIKKLMSLGTMLNLNQTIDFETAEILTLDYGKTLKKSETQDITNFEEYEIVDNAEDLVDRPPVITVMGHVDHGKTTLLDYIRSTRVAEGEAGGITQAIGAYQTEKDGHKITFIDTPGHAAFTQMRARGASVTDIVVIIVAADDGVMPQTKEAIDHAKSAGVPIIVAVNKIDKPNINIERVYTEMSENGITPESWGGEYPFINLSAKTGEGVDTLLETILAIAEVKELKANPNRYALGAVIEEKLDKNVGGLSSFLILNGTLRLGDPVVVGTTYGKVRTMKNDKGESIVEAGPSTPVEITGLNDTPKAGDKFMAFETIEEAKEVAEKRKNIEKEKSNVKKNLSLDELFESVNAGQKEVAVVLKADVRGSEEAVKSALENIKVKDVRVKVIRSGIGPISESDIVLASASKAIVIGFNVVSSSDAKAMAKEYGIEIRCYTIIYKLVEDVEAALNGMLDPEYEEKIIGSATIRQIFKFSKVGNIAGVYVTDGIVKNNANVRVIRDGKILIDTKISSIQRGKDQAKEVKKGFECGITLEKYDDFKEGDTFEVYVMEQVKHA